MAACGRTRLYALYWVISYSSSFFRLSNCIPVSILVKKFRVIRFSRKSPTFVGHLGWRALLHYFASFRTPASTFETGSNFGDNGYWSSLLLPKLRSFPSEFEQLSQGVEDRGSGGGGWGWSWGGRGGQKGGTRLK